MFNYEQSAMSSRAAVVALHSLAPEDGAATTPDAIRTQVRPHHPTRTRGLGLRCVVCGGQLRMLSVAYNNLGVALFGLGLETDLPALRLIAERAVATAELAAVAPGTVSSAPLRTDHA